MELELENLEAFYGSSQVLFGIDMTIEEGSVIGLLGRNGAGKTTTFRSIAGISPPQISGSIRHGGDEITNLAPNEISKRGIKLVPEEREMIPTLTIEENLQLGALRADVSYEERLDYVYDIFPQLKELKNSMGNQVSGGEAQMGSIARALMSDPEVLLLDEPTEGLAPIIVQDLVEVLSELAEEGYTILLVEQNVHAALQITERNYVIQNGEIVHTATSDELAEDDEVVQEYLGMGL